MVWKYAGRYVLPFSPSSMKMSIRWNTALTDTISSVNTRSLSKEYPQFTVNYSALLKGAGLQFATDRVLRDLAQEVLVPMWQDVATERISDTEVSMSSTDKTFYKVGSQVMLWASDTEWQIVDVEQVNPTYIKFGVNSTDWKCVVPIEEGFIASSPTTSTDRNRNTKLNYVVTIKRLDGPLSSTGGGVIPGVYVDSMIGNGIDSYIKLATHTFTSFVSFKAHIEIDTIPTGNGYIYSFNEDIPSAIQPPFRIFIKSDRTIQVMAYGSFPASSAVRKYINTNETIPLNIRTEVFCYLDLNNSSNQIQVFIDEVLATIKIEDNDSFSSLYTPTNPVNTCGCIISSGNRIAFFDGEISELYTSTNPLAKTPALIEQYATGQEHFTQVAPDALPADWLGGAVQGIIEISPPSGAPVVPYPELPKLTEVPIQSSKGNNYSLHLNTVKSVGGVIKVNSMRSVPTVTTTQSWDNQSRSEYLSMLDFAAQCRGRKNAFDSASFKSDIIPLNNGAISDGYLDVLDPGLQSLNLVGTRFTVIRGRSWDSSEVYEVLSLENVTGGVRLVLDKAIIATIFTTDTVSNVRQSRLNSDVLEVNIDSFNRSSASISVRDINEGG